MVKIGPLELPHFPLLLAPMEDVSDPPFRHLCKMHGADLMFTEFVSSEGLIRNAKKSLKKLDISDDERPMGIQIFGGDLDSMKQAAEIAAKANPEIIDINYGCPVNNVVSKNAGAGILKDIPKMVRITEEIVKSTTLPVTVKTRLGWDEKTRFIVDVAERLQDAGIKAITIHGRTRQQMFKGISDWTLIGEVKNNPRMKIPVFGNGDVDSPVSAMEKRDKYGVDGIMIGRAAIGNPWIFNEIKHFLLTGKLLPLPTVAERLNAVRLHLSKSMEWKGDRVGMLEIRRHYTNYFKGIPHFKKYRNKLVTAPSLPELETILDEIESLSLMPEPFYQ